MRKAIMGAVLLMMFSGSAQALPIVLGSSQVYGGHTYYVLSQSTWWDAETEAVALGGHLVTVGDQAENDWLMATFGSAALTIEGFWLGLSDVATEGTHVWTSGEPATYLHWFPGEPNNMDDEDYVHMYSPLYPGGTKSSYWNDIDGDWGGGSLQGLVEVPAVNGVPDPGSSLLLFGLGVAGLGAWRRRLG
ncbi:MAG: VPDSG-CTERM sorting domain-containing protein [Vicinamibacterales bacterium]